MEGFESFVSRSRGTLSRWEFFSKNIESQFHGLDINDDDSEIKNMVVFARWADSIEEQL